MGRNVLITGIGSAGGKNAVKSLLPHEEYRLLGTDGDQYSFPLYDDAFAATKVVPWATDPGYTEAILSFATNFEVDVVFPTFDEAVVALSDARDRFEERDITVIVPGPDAVATANDKYETYLAAREAGVATPETWSLDDESDLATVAEHLPAVIKPSVGRGAEGVTFCESRADLKDAYETLVAGGYDPIAQEEIPGPPDSVRLFAGLYDATGDLRTSYCSRTVRTKYDFGGPATVGRPIKSERIERAATSLLETIGSWCGVVNVEFKFHEMTGEPQLLEINPRYWGYSYLATAAGINFPRYAVELAGGAEVEVPTDYRTDIVSIRTSDDRIVETSEIEADVHDNDRVAK
jgi:predicted ATP-grasp superfamily ATP-dependent carboligase